MILSIAMQPKLRLPSLIKDKVGELAGFARDLSRTQVVIILILMTALAVSSGINYYKTRPVEIVVENPGKEEKQESVKIAVHVTGAVANPGLYEIDDGARVSDAVEMAGGPLQGAELGSINLASKLKDGMQICVPVTAEAASGVNGDDCTIENSAGCSLININTGNVEELQELPGIGPSYASRIVEYRKSNGPFSSIDELENVKGIGSKTVEEIRDMVTL